MRSVWRFLFSSAFKNSISGMFRDTKVLTSFMRLLLYAATHKQYRSHALKLYERILSIGDGVAWDFFGFALPFIGKSKSMDFQDIVALYVTKVSNDSKIKLFNGRNYIEIGAYDGKDKSNTYLLEQLGWSGILIEPNPKSYMDCKSNRKTAITIHGAMVGSDNELPKEYMAYYWDNTKISNGTTLEEHAKERGFNEVLNVRNYKISDLVSLSGILNFAYISIDTEGGELEIARSILADDDCNVLLFSIEHNYDKIKRGEYFLLFNSYGYALLFPGLGRNDDFFIKKTYWLPNRYEIN